MLRLIGRSQGSDGWSELTEIRVVSENGEIIECSVADLATILLLAFSEVELEDLHPSDPPS